MCDGQHDLDVCKAFNDITVEERSKFLSKPKLCYGCYEVTSPKHTARNCPRRRNCHICLEKHPTGLHEYMIRRKDGSKSDDDDFQERLSKIIVPTSKTFSLNQLELEKLLACV